MPKKNNEITVQHEESPSGGYSIVIRIQGELPKAMNKVMRAHWSKNHKDRNHWHKLIGSAVLPFRPEKPLSRFRIYAVRQNYRTLDYDGLVASLKPCIDALKGLVIEDDTWAMTGQWYVTQTFVPKKTGSSLILIITDLGDTP